MDDKLARVSAQAQQSRREAQVAEVALGQWYWLKVKCARNDAGEAVEPHIVPTLCCVMHVGSNYVKLQSVAGWSWRVHESSFDVECTLEEDPETYLKEKVEEHRRKMQALLGRVQQLTASLGITRAALSPGTGAADSATSSALVAAQGTADVQAHKAALVKAKEETLPTLFKEVEEENAAMVRWMEGTLLPLRANIATLKKSTEKIEDSIFTVELYAGLVEDLVKIKDGEAAPNETKVALFQRRHYMDEECLANYAAGGMEFASMTSFDAWLLAPENLERILPLQRCVVAFRVRRIMKDRSCHSLLDFINIQVKEQQDRYTYLYIRNGQQVWRLITEIDFGVELFPNKEDSKLLNNRENLWANVRHGVEEVVTDTEYRAWLEDQAVKAAKYKAEKKVWESLSKEERRGKCSPHDWSQHHGKTWVKVSRGSVYYDDVMQQIAKTAMEHNRVAVVLQGLLDRSLALHPHPPWQLWTFEGFTSGVELIYDVSRALANGEAPDFEAYQQRLNKSIGKGSFTIGQNDAWEQAEAEKENKRRARRSYDYNEVRRFAPYGNPGPGLIAKVAQFSKRKGACTFKWQRERQRRTYRSNCNPIGTQFSCHVDSLLNVSAYTPGDYKIFFADPRTRADYLQWAPWLLAAEDWHAEVRNGCD